MFIIFGIIGLLIISTAIWLKNEKRQDLLFIIGGISLLIYSVSIGDIIFILLQIIFIISAFVEIVRLPKKK
ncbi:MAG: YgjV family protein [Candidatus Paceibacterota bacterium]|jgi:hypothetical protein